MKNFIVFSVALLATACVFRKFGEATDVKTGNGGRNLNYAVGGLVLYEVQLRSANACDPAVGTSEQRAACRDKISPTIPYRAENMTCDDLARLKAIRLGTIGDMLDNSNDYKKGITTRYIKESVGANAIWIMPPFPNNDQWNIPDRCDDLGSPYAVRDYMHMAGTLSRACIQAGKDEYSSEPCWGNDDFDRLISDAHAKGMRVMLDVAFNHFGHNYLMYDYQDYTSTADRIAAGQNLASLWNFDATYEQNLEHPKLLDSKAILERRASQNQYDARILAQLRAKCPSLDGDHLVRAFNSWRNAVGDERRDFNCAADAYLERTLPGFYLAENARDPLVNSGNSFTNNWRDVKFLYHHESNAAHAHEYVRNREYLFRVLNYWSSRGVDGFRLDHSTEGANGLSPNFWKYVTWKVAYYAQKRGQERPFFMAEEFNGEEQPKMAQVVDFMTEGYVFGITGRNGETKDSAFIERSISGEDRFSGNTYVLTALETHDEPRLTERTGYNQFTGAGFWGAGAATWSVPMILMGQEFGETYGLGFRRSDYLRARFPGSPTYFEQGEDLRNFYKSMITARLKDENRALRAAPREFLRLNRGDGVDTRIFAMMKWTEDGNVVFAFHNLWEQDVENHYFISPDVAAAASISEDIRYQLVDALTGGVMGACRTGAELKIDFPVIMGSGTRAQWLRLERCP